MAVRRSAAIAGAARRVLVGTAGFGDVDPHRILQFTLSPTGQLAADGEITTEAVGGTLAAVPSRLHPG